MNIKNEITGKTKDHLLWSEEDQAFIHRDVLTSIKSLKKTWPIQRNRIKNPEWVQKL